MSITYLPLQPVSSTNVAGIGYDAPSGTLQVQFNNGNIYQYSGVDAATHQALVTADSVGSSLRSLLSGFDYENLGNPDSQD